MKYQIVTLDQIIDTLLWRNSAPRLSHHPTIDDMKRVEVKSNVLIEVSLENNSTHVEHLN